MASCPNTCWRPVDKENLQNTCRSPVVPPVSQIMSLENGNALLLAGQSEVPGCKQHGISTTYCRSQDSHKDVKLRLLESKGTIYSTVPENPLLFEPGSFLRAYDIVHSNASDNAGLSSLATDDDGMEHPPSKRNEKSRLSSNFLRDSFDSQISTFKK